MMNITKNIVTKREIDKNVDLRFKKKQVVIDMFIY